MKTPPRPFHAVITGDLVDSSSKSAPGEPARVLKQLRSIFSAVTKEIRGLEEFQIFRGDSFQTALHAPAEAVTAALILRCQCLLRIQLDLRIAIGIGPVEHHPKTSVGEGSGPAFTYSGRGLDEMAEPRRMVLRTPDKFLNAEMIAFTALLDAVVRSWSTRSLAVAAERLAGKTQEEIAAKLKISQSAVSQRLAVAQWWAVEAALERWRQASASLTKPYKGEI